VKKANTKKPAAKKPAPKAAPKKLTKPAPKKAAPQKPAKVVAKKPVEKPAKPVEKKAPGHENKSLVSVKPQIKPIVKKEPPKPGKVVIPKTTTKSVKKYEPEFTKSVLDSQAQDPGAPVHRYSDAELVEFREIIGKKLDAAKKELNYLQGLITRKDESGDMDEGRYMTMEDGSVSMEREQLSQMASRQITFIDHLEKAMMRIENKTYGICRVTGKLIDKARLRAVPHATLSIEAKQMMNK
jgi:RNA polymerase-binding transcription factor DksA